MPFKKYFNEVESVGGPGCIHLRSKAMYVTGSVRAPEHPDEEGERDCWCNVTQHVIGPDQVLVGPAVCVPGRNCFREVYDV